MASTKRQQVNNNTSTKRERVTEPTSAPIHSLALRASIGACIKLLIAFAVFTSLALAITRAAGFLFTENEILAGMTHRISRGNLVVNIEEQGILESEENYEIKSKVRGRNAVLWIVESGSYVKKGDELVRLDSLLIQEQVDERTKYANWSQSGADSSAARLARAKLAVGEYDQGRFRTEVMSMEKDIAVSKSALQNARDRLKHSKMMASSGFVS